MMKRRHFLKEISAAAAVPLAGCNILGEKSDDSDQSSSYPIARKKLGETGIEVSRLGFGSHLKKELIADPVYRDSMIKRGFEGGINFFDVYNHSGYLQFKPMGESLRDFRKEAVISLCAVNITSALEAEIDGALKDFNTDYIDLYRLYTINDDRMLILEKAREAGKIRAIGIVEHNASALRDYIERYRSTLNYVMLVYNFHHNKAIILSEHLKRDFENDYAAIFPLIEELKLGVIGIKPMGSDSMIELAQAHNYFDKPGINIAQAMLRYVFQCAEIDTAVTAMNSMEEVETNLDAAYKSQLSTAEKQALEELSALATSMESAYLPDHYKWLENWAVRTV